MRPYIEVPMLQITVRARENRRRDIRLDVSRQHNFLRRCGPLRRNNRNGGYRQIRGFRAKTGVCVDALKNTGNQQSNEQQENRNAGKQPRKDRRFVPTVVGECGPCPGICPSVCDCVIGITLAGSAFLAHLFPGRCSAPTRNERLRQPTWSRVCAPSSTPLPWKTQKLADNVTMLSGPGGSVTVLNGPDGNSSWTLSLRLPGPGSKRVSMALATLR